MTTKAVHILGYFQDRFEVPMGDGAEVWGLNQLYQIWPEISDRWTRWFEMHDFDFMKKWKPAYIDWLAKQTRPIYMQKHHPEIPASVEYPRAEINAFLGQRFGFSHDYFTSSFSYMLAVALHEHFEKVGLYGIGLIEDGECIYERAGLEYLVGIAQGSGVSVTFGKASPMLKIAYVYGYTEPRMRVADVAPVCDFLDQNAAILKSNAASLAETLAVLDKAHPQYFELAEALMTADIQRHLLKDMRVWLKHYGRGGTLIAPDGTLNT